MVSNAQMIKKSYRELLSDNRRHTRTELFEYAQRQALTDEGYTQGMLTGALKSLVSDESQYECVERGVYQKLTGENRQEEADFLGQYIEILEKTVWELDNGIHVNPLDIVDMTDTDKLKLKKVQKCIENIRSTVEFLKE